MKVVFSSAAEADLEGIGDYIAADSPHRAIPFVRELRAAAKRLANMPTGFPLLPRYEERGIRRYPVRNDLIFYRISGKTISIVRIIHGARDFESLLFPDEI